MSSTSTAAPKRKAEKGAPKGAKSPKAVVAAPAPKASVSGDPDLLTLHISTEFKSLIKQAAEARAKETGAPCTQVDIARLALERGVAGGKIKAVDASMAHFASERNFTERIFVPRAKALKAALDQLMAAIQPAGMPPVHLQVVARAVLRSGLVVRDGQGRLR